MRKVLFLSVAVFLVVLMAIFAVIPIKYDCGHICSITESRKGSISYLGGIYRRDDFWKTKLHEWAELHDYEFEHDWVQIRGTTIRLWGGIRAHAPAPEILSIPQPVLDMYVQEEDDSDIEKLLDEMKKGTSIEKKELLNRIAESVILQY
jgi:hypothetical protein